MILRPAVWGQLAHAIRLMEDGARVKGDPDMEPLARNLGRLRTLVAQLAERDAEQEPDHAKLAQDDESRAIMEAAINRIRGGL